MLAGVDVSSYQGNAIDWPVAKANGGLSFAVAKVTEGAGRSAYRDPTFARNWAGIKAAGLYRGAYHFARLSDNTPENEAALYLETRGPLSAGDFAVIDVEAGTGDLSAAVLAWCAIVTKADGVVPWLYTGRWFSTDHLTDTRLGTYPLWLAAYQLYAPPPVLPWPIVSCWQTTDSANVPGIGRCDADIFLGTAPQLSQLVKGVPPPAHEWPTAAVYVVKVVGGDGQTTNLRVSPRLDAPWAGPVKNGDRLIATGGWTYSWRAISTARGVKGWVYAGNIIAA